MSIGNIAPVPFSLNRSKHNAPPGDYLGDENSLAFVHMHDAKDQEPYFVREWPKKRLENDKDDACAFAYMTMARWLALYKEWLRLPVVSLLSSAGNNGKKARIRSRVGAGLQVRPVRRCNADYIAIDIRDNMITFVRNLNYEEWTKVIFLL